MSEVPPAGASPSPSGSARTVYLAARLVGLVSLAAFVSLHVQAIGLLGEQGLLPLAPRLARVDPLDAPSLFFVLGGSDDALHAVALFGELASLALALGVLPGLAALLAWVAYLSFLSVGWPFFPLQWDTLLCEALVLVAATSPWDRLVVHPRALPEPTPLARAALVFLVCRLHFASGLVKLLSGDSTWRGLTALDFHFETQPLPGPLAPYAHHLPSPVHAALTALTLILEVVIPPLAIARRARPLVFASFVALQLGILATGNYGFFNVLTLALSLPLLDDAQLAALTARLPRLASWLSAERSDPEAQARASRRRALVLVPLVALAALDLHGSLGGLVPEPFDRALARVSSLRLTSPYGLFAVMTTERDEIVLEGSDDGERWVELVLPYEPGPVDRALPIVPLHMPRLDWMLWFAALGEADDSPWVLALERAVLEGRAPVRGLFADAPARPPRFVRALRYRYRLAEGGPAVWSREARGPFGPTLRR